MSAGIALTMRAESLTWAVLAASSRSSSKRRSTRRAERMNSPCRGAPVRAETASAVTMRATPGAFVLPASSESASVGEMPHDTLSEARANSRWSGPLPVAPT